eukprot:7023736-Pyramimonas_sp.AAC.1
MAQPLLGCRPRPGRRHSPDHQAHPTRTPTRRGLPQRRPGGSQGHRGTRARSSRARSASPENDPFRLKGVVIFWRPSEQQQ